MDVESFARMTPIDRLLEDEECLDLEGWDLRVMWTPGHTPGHICLRSDRHRVFLSGDHVLPRITPNISFYPQQKYNPLADYLESLAKIERLDSEEVLPGHQWRFSGLSDRVRELREHHHIRLDEICGLLVGGEWWTCWQVAKRLTWSRPIDDLSANMRRAAAGETLAHLVYLESANRVVRTKGRPERFTLRNSSLDVR
jgi:glyoxylase-like metal-dependent hydrolase (beta-lactamase superfamily II)